MKLAIDAGKVRGRAFFHTYRKEGGIIKDRKLVGVGDNLITNYGMEQLPYPYWNSRGANHANQIRSSVYVGSGGSLPKYTDTKLDNQIRSASSTKSSDGWGYQPPVGFKNWSRSIATFAPSSTYGAYNVSEFSFGGGNNVRTRALVRSPINGQPVSLSIKEGEYLEIDYTVEVHFLMPERVNVAINGHPNMGGTLGGDLVGGMGTVISTSSYDSVFRLRQRDSEGWGSVLSNHGEGTNLPRVFNPGGSVLVSRAVILPPSSDDYSFGQISFDRSSYANVGQKGTPYGGFYVAFDDEITVPAGHEMKINLGFNFARDPEPTE